MRKKYDKVLKDRHAKMCRNSYIVTAGPYSAGARYARNTILTYFYKTFGQAVRKFNSFRGRKYGGAMIINHKLRVFRKKSASSHLDSYMAKYVGAMLKYASTKFS